MLTFLGDRGGDDQAAGARRAGVPGIERDRRRVRNGATGFGGGRPRRRRRCDRRADGRVRRPRTLHWRGHALLLRAAGLLHRGRLRGRAGRAAGEAARRDRGGERTAASEIAPDRGGGHAAGAGRPPPSVPMPTPHVYVADMLVHATARRLGVGGALLRAVSGYTRDWEVEMDERIPMVLSVDSDNGAARSLYEQFGFDYLEENDIFCVMVYNIH